MPRETAVREYFSGAGIFGHILQSVTCISKLYGNGTLAILKRSLMQKHSAFGELYRLIVTV